MHALVVEEPQLLHVLPGRMRWHVPRWSGVDPRGIEAHLRQVPGVRSVQANPLTRNILIHCVPSATNAVALHAALRRISLYDVLRKHQVQPRTDSAPHGRVERPARGVLVALWSNEVWVRPDQRHTRPGQGAARLAPLVGDFLLLLARFVVPGGALALLLDGIEVVRLVTALAEWLACQRRPDSRSRALHPYQGLLGAYGG